MKKIRIKNILKDTFSFEKNIDINDECEVLHRRNVVIKNIIFFSNLIYTVILMVLSFGEKSNWVLTIICFPVTFVVNQTLKSMINKSPNDLVKQQIAMYFCSFYMFLTALLLYFKLRTGSQTAFHETGYILIYYALVVVSLYQDSAMLKRVSVWLIAIVTVLHFTLTYNIIGADYATDLMSFIKNFFTSHEFRDIALRTILLISFIIVLLAIVKISEYLQDERKKELQKRKQVEEDFTNVVKEMFDVTLSKNQFNNEERNQTILLSEMSYKLASYLGMSPTKCNEVKEYAVIHLSKKVDLDLSNITDKDEQFEKLRVQTSLGNTIIRRLELRRKSEDIIRAHEEGFNTEEFMQNEKQIQNDVESQIILICDMYISLRSPRNYKRPWAHSKSIELLKNEYRFYFDSEVFDRFIKFELEFEDLFNNY